VPTRFGPVAVPATYNASMFNPFIGGLLGWDLGGGLGVSYILGAYIGVSDSLADKSSFLINRGSLSYTANGWNLTASAVVGAALDTVNPLLNPNAHPDYLNVDLTATKAFGKWEVGAVGFYSTDLDSVNQVPFYQKQSQFALGGLVGYDWGELKTQVYLTRDVHEQNYGGFDTRVWGRVLVPLGDPFAPASPGMMYHK
jgi:Putative MetA-pathway of phenol degradation